MPDETQVGQEPTTSKEAPTEGTEATEAAAPKVTTTTRTRKSAAKKAPAKKAPAKKAAQADPQADAQAGA